MANEQVLERDRRPGVRHRARAVQRRDQHPAEAAARPRSSRELEQQIRDSLNAAEDKARETRRAHDDHRRSCRRCSSEHLHARSLSGNPRYKLLNEQIFAARGEDLEISITGVERLNVRADSIAPEAACTSVQLHQLVHPEDFARYWNAAQAIAGVQVAVGANSPFFFGKELWRETRIALFEQATDTRPEELKAQGVRPRVWFGERWITSIFDLFEENVRYFPALLPLVDDEDPVEVLERGDIPHARRAQAAQRHRLPLEPAGLRGRPRPAAPARGEPRPAVGPDRRRHARQRRLLLRPRAHARRERAADLVADVVLGRRGQPARGRPRRARRARLLARRRRRPRQRARAAPAAPARPRGTRALRRRPARPRPPDGDHRAPLRRSRPTARAGRAASSARSTTAAGSTASRRCAR